MMRKTMNLKSLIEGSHVTLGDEVKVGRDDEEKRDGIVKVPHGPSNTTGVLIDGELEMAPKDEIQRQRTDERTDMERARRAMTDAEGTPQYKTLKDRFEKMKGERDRTDEAGSDPFHDGAVACSKGVPISANPHGADSDESDRWESGWRAEASHERAAKRADYADDFGDEAADEYMRESDGDDADADEADEDVLEESMILGMTMMPSLARMQQLAGIRTEGALPDFLKKDDEDDSEDDQAEEAETDEAPEGDEATEGNEEAEEVETDTVSDEEGDQEGEDEGEVEVAVVAADDEPSDEVVQAAQDMETAVEDQPTDELSPNHPATAPEVTMMSVPKAPIEAEAQPEPEPAADPVDVCMKALAELESQLPNVSVKDFANINKRLTAIQSSLFEGHTGRRRKTAVTEMASRPRPDDVDSYSIELKDSPMGEKYAVYGWGEYPRNSVLAGQTMKKFIDWFDTEEEARAAYPEAEGDVGFRDAHNTYSHLPGEDDPVPGGRYPDDI